MATHGLLLGAAVGLGVFAHHWRTAFYSWHALLIPVAFLMGMGLIARRSCHA
jgi:hypothetical protein